MKVRELVEHLNEYNPNADIKVMAHSRGYAFTMAYGSSEGTTPLTAETVCLYVDELMSKEQAQP